MQINQDYNTAAYTIRSYDSGKVTLAVPLRHAETPPQEEPNQALRRMPSKELKDSFIVMPDRLIENWQPQSFDALESTDFDVLIQFQPELVLLATGDTLRFPRAEITARLHEHRIGVEVMNVAAACRTYNFLMSDGRKVAAAVLLES